MQTVILPRVALTNYDHAYYKNLNDDVFLLSVKQLKEWVYENRSTLGSDYWSKMFSGQLQKGAGYDKLQRAISVVLLDKSFTRRKDVYHTMHQVADLELQEILSDKMSIHMIELPKVPDPFSRTRDSDELDVGHVELSREQKWLLFF